MEIDEQIDYSSFLNNHEENVYLLFGVDPALDFANPPKVKSSLKNAKLVVGFSAFDSTVIIGLLRYNFTNSNIC